MAGATRPNLQLRPPADVLRAELNRLEQWDTELTTRAHRLRHDLATVGMDQDQLRTAIDDLNGVIARLDAEAGEQTDAEADAVPDGQHLDGDGAVSGHSRACGFQEHVHGPSCARDCPGCGGRP